MGNRERNGTLTDGEILKLYFRRDEFAVAETDRKYGSYLLRTAERFLADRRDREECVADTYLGGVERHSSRRAPLHESVPHRAFAEKCGEPLP